MDKPVEKPQAVERSRPGNELSSAVPKFCLALEEFRRTPDGRVRTSQEFQAHFFTYDDKGSKDEVFRHLPKEIRGPILSTWGIRGLKAALRDDDAKVESVVYDALVAGDVDHAAFEDGLTAELSIRWVPLTSWWSFWRGGKLTKKAIGKALESAFDLGLFDARWFLDTLEGRGGQLKGTDVLSEGLTKADLTEWVKKIHASADGTPKGLVAALGWEKIVAQTANDTLTAVLDSFANKCGLIALAAGSTAADKRPEASAAAPSTQGSPPIIASVTREPTKGEAAPDKSETKSSGGKKSNAPPPNAAPNAAAKSDAKKPETKAETKGEAGEVESHTTETEAVGDDSMIVVVDEDPVFSSAQLGGAGRAAIPDTNEEDEEATAVFSLTEEALAPIRRK